MLEIYKTNEYEKSLPLKIMQHGMQPCREYDLKTHEVLVQIEERPAACLEPQGRTTSYGGYDRAFGSVIAISESIAYLDHNQIHIFFIDTVTQ